MAKHSSWAPWVRLRLRLRVQVRDRFRVGVGVMVQVRVRVIRDEVILDGLLGLGAVRRWSALGALVRVSTRYFFLTEPDSIRDTEPDSIRDTEPGGIHEQGTECSALNLTVTVTVNIDPDNP